MTATSDGAGGRTLRLWLFFSGWTLFAAGTAWWLLHSANSEHTGSQLFFDSSQNGRIPVGDQIKRWLKVADLSLRGAYPWVLLAPYVIWLSSRFLLERGRLRSSLPVHLLAGALFIFASHTLATRSMSKRNFVVRVFEHKEGRFMTNVPLTSLETGNPKDHIQLHSYTSHLGDIETKVIVTAGPGGKTLPPELSEAETNLLKNVRPGEDFLEKLGLGPGQEPFQTTAAAGWRSSVRYDSLLFSGLLNILAYGSFAGLVHAVHFYRRSRERERRAMLLESHLANARLHTLKAQLQPHFLFNALNAVSTLLQRDSGAAHEALTSFSELLRLALNQSDKQEVSLRDDLLFLERYVEIQQTRLGDRFRFEQNVDPLTLNCLVPTLFLQPLVENSIRHGIELSSVPGMVRVIIQRNGEHLVLSVEDNGVGLEKSEMHGKTGTGLSNLRARLDALYGGDHKIEILPRAEGGVAVRMEIPVRNGSTETRNGS